MYIRPIIFLLSSLFMPGCVAGQVTLRVAAQLESEPKFIAQENAIGGSCIDIFRAIEKADPEIKFSGHQRWMPLKRIEAMVGARQLDAICGLIRNEERAAAYSIPDTPLFTVTYHLLVRADDPVNIRSWDDVRKLGDDGVILVNAGSGPVNSLAKVGSLKIDSAAGSTGSNIEKLLVGRGRFFYYRQPGLNSEVRKSGHAGKVRVLPTALDSQAFYLMLGTHVGKETESRISHALEKLSESGELKQIAEKWSGY